MKITGTTLRARRQRLGLSQAKLSELCGVSQHLLSAYELGKADLPAPLVDIVSLAISDDVRVAGLVGRRKRYQEHRYVARPALQERIARAARTIGNIQYCKVLEKLSADHGNCENKTLSALSLFSGCGGFSLGFSAAGFEVKGFLEIGDELRQTYRENFRQSAELGGNINDIDQGGISRIAQQLGPIDIVIGGPPCQGFSLSGKRQVEDPRNSLFKQYLRFVDVLRPRMAVLENVRLLTSMKATSGGLVKNEICAEFENHGYFVKAFEVNAKKYGVPQHRERVFFVAVRDDLGIDPTFPERTHGHCRNLFTKAMPFRTFADACSDLPFLESGETSADPLHEAVKHPEHVVKWLWDVPEGRSAHDNDDSANRPPSGYNTTYKRQVWNEPGSTVQTTFGMISGCRNVHPIATRSLTIREAARLQSFPDSYQFVGGLGSIRTGIGNAVPPILAYAIAEHSKQILTNLVKVSGL